MNQVDLDHRVDIVATRIQAWLMLMQGMLDANEAVSWHGWTIDSRRVKRGTQILGRASLKELMLTGVLDPYALVLEVDGLAGALKRRRVVASMKTVDASIRALEANELLNELIGALRYC
jgi:hypothetical protein